MTDPQEVARKLMDAECRDCFYYVEGNISFLDSGVCSFGDRQVLGCMEACDEFKAEGEE